MTIKNIDNKVKDINSFSTIEEVKIVSPNIQTRIAVKAVIEEMLDNNILFNLKIFVAHIKKLIEKKATGFTIEEASDYYVYFIHRHIDEIMLSEIKNRSNK